jgi:fido (protein-threonine AMPylation protein)
MDGFIEVDIKNPFKFNIFNFSSRYFAGGDSLKDLRSVSRKRFSLAQAGLNNFDLDAHKLVKQTASFVNAVKLLRSKKTLSINHLTEVNRMTCSENRLSGRVRNFQNWVGKSIETASYVPPHHNELHSLLDIFITNVNSENLFPNEEHKRKIYLYSQFILIHPFADGNGRCARALWFSCEKTNFEHSVPDLLYRLIEKSSPKHDEAVRLIKTGDFSHAFWTEMSNWSNMINMQIRPIIDSLAKHISNILFLRKTSPLTEILISNLLDNPYIYPEYFCRRENISINDFIQEAMMLEDIGLLVRKGVSYDKKIVIFECEFISKMHKKMEELIFKNGD